MSDFTSQTPPKPGFVGRPRTTRFQVPNFTQNLYRRARAAGHKPHSQTRARILTDAQTPRAGPGRLPAGVGALSPVGLRPAMLPRCSRFHVRIAGGLDAYRRVENTVVGIPGRMRADRPAYGPFLSSGQNRAGDHARSERSKSAPGRLIRAGVVRLPHRRRM